MFSAQARVASDRPERYVKQVVEHLSHRLTTRVEADGRGVVEVAGGRCTLTPEPGALVLAAIGDDEAALRHAQDVVGRHLERFGAWAGLRVDWSSVEGG